MTQTAAARALVREATPREIAAWDELVTQFTNHRLVHRAAWIRSLERSGVGQPLWLVFEYNGDVAGCLPGLLVRLGPIRLFGSPLEGWQTVSLGPAFDPARLTTADMMKTLVPYLEHRHGVHHVELMSRDLDPADMVAAGFREHHVVTYRVPLHVDDPAATLRAFKESARRNVRRAAKLGLVVQFEDDESFVDEHYDQLCEVYARNGVVVPFGKRRVLECFRHMRAAGQLIAVSVRLPDAATRIATGMFFQDGRELLLWTWTHRTRYRWYRATELMTWTVMQRAMAAGCTSIDFMGGGDFKAKLGGEPELSKSRWIRSRYRWLTAARSAAAHGYRWQQALRGRLGQLRLAIADRLPGNGGRSDLPAHEAGA